MSLPLEAAEQFTKILDSADAEAIEKLRRAVAARDPVLCRVHTYAYNKSGEICSYCPIAFIANERGLQPRGSEVRELITASSKFTSWLDCSGREVWDQLLAFITQYQTEKKNAR